MKKSFIFITILLVIVLGLLWFIKKDDQVDLPPNEKSAEQVPVDQVKISFLDIGQGDATLIEFPDSQQMLVDCSIDGRIIEALGRVMDFYDHKIDYLLVTHPDLDHYGGCIDVLNRFDVGEIIYNDLNKEYDNFWLSFMGAIDSEVAQGATYFIVDKEDSWDIAGAKLHFLYPDHPIDLDSRIPSMDKDTGANDTSVVLKLSYQDQDVLLMGDAEIDLEDYLIKTYGEQLDVEVLKVGHHGSNSSSNSTFVSSTSPLYSVISAGKNNKFGHPSPRVLKRLERSESKILRTDLEGDIIININNGELIVGQ
ncbi:MAG: hypothetical protein COX81_03925 [Candidatus Magasanikbacteria bacterium CG_4_10_14_0_2_um_filter_37_12]|uniref:Metallo-beta-lactamase domain-containing protein n=1 Tax=Candidatus Magasanikbacteria bacterium CG_4_10_14_0_2_um_filter_37_12 TaxID=1974637 RepID=A0A2M7V6S4_9BACT|nr:MAG: hypothetical protein COX81_03925 [Candidatus Magasanikbacteria bacterium CG_4_10_14_0_2_um_filter_37_12]